MLETDGVLSLDFGGCHGTGQTDRKWRRHTRDRRRRHTRSQTSDLRTRVRLNPPSSANSERGAATRTGVKNPRHVKPSRLEAGRVL